MTRTTLTAALLTTIAMPALAAPQTLTLDRVTFADPTTNQPAAATVLKPQGWTVRGGVKWYHDFAHKVSYEFTITNPRGPEQIETFPIYYFTHNTQPVFAPRPLEPYMGQVWLAPHDAVSMLERVTIPGFRSQQRYQVTQRVALKDLAQKWSQVLKQDVQAARVRIEFVQNGVALEEDFYIVLSYYQQRDAMGTITNWSPVLVPFAVRDRKGELDSKSPQLLASAFSFSPTPEFYKRVRIERARFIGILAEAQRLTRMDAAAVFATHQSIQAIYRDTVNHWDASNTRRHQTMQDLLGGVAPYRDESGTTYVLPHEYSHYWTNNQGTILMTNDVNFDPNINSSHTWNQLQPTRR